MTRSGQGRNEVRELLARHQVQPRRSLGQHFLADPNLVDRIVRLANVTAGDQVVEVGAGTGSLTRALAATGATVVAYEIDDRLRPVLEEVVGDLRNVELRFADAAELEGFGNASWVMVANLPYHVGTEILLDALQQTPGIVRFVVMTQREVADRLVARPGGKTYGLPSVIVALYADARLAFPVAPAVFTPQPPVDSAVLEIVRKPAPAAASRAVAIAAAAFGQRRKMVRRSLTQVIDDPQELLRKVGIDPTRRAEQLSPKDYLALAEGRRAP